ncbi:MAG: transporter substrate-binding domain-containing protein [Oleispira sp.]
MKVLRGAIQLLLMSVVLMAYSETDRSEIDRSESVSSIRIAVDEWPPYQSQNYTHYGSAHRIISEAFASEGVEAEYGWHPWARSLMFVRNGEWDAAALSQKTEDKERYFLFSDPVMQAEKVFFYLKDTKFDWKSLEDLKTVAIGGTIGYSYGESFDLASAEGAINMVRTTTNTQGFKMLLERRTSVFLLEKRAGYFLLSKEFPKQAHLITHHSKSVQTVNYHVIFSKRIIGIEDHIVRFNRGLNELKQQGLVELYLLEGLSGEYTPVVE